MDLDKIRNWIELTGQYQKNDFWRNLFSQPLPEKILKADDAFPLYDVYRGHSSINIIIELPGINRNDLSIALRQKSALVVKGKSAPFFPADTEIKKERFYGDFERVIPLPEPADSSSIQVNFYEGLVQVTYPRQNGGQVTPELDERLF